MHKSSRILHSYLKPLLEPKNWQFWLVVGLITNSAIWSLSLLYLKLAQPVYISRSAINVPIMGSNTDINLPDIGQAKYESSSPYGSSSSQDPRENYKLIALSEPLLKKAANLLHMTPEEFGKPRIKLADNTTLVTIEFQGTSSQQAQNKALTFYKVFETKIEDLRNKEASQRDLGYQNALASSQKKLDNARKRLDSYRASSGLSSEQQINNLTVNIEQLRRQKAEILAQQQPTNNRIEKLSTDLNLPAEHAADAFVLQADQVFQQNLKNYSQSSAALVALESEFFPNHPTVIAEKAKRDAAQKALLARSQSLLGRSLSPAILQQFNLSSTNSNSAREQLFQELVKLQVAQQELGIQARAIDTQITQLEKRLKQLAGNNSKLEALKRDLQVAEIVFSSTLTRLNLGKSNILGSYPLVQVVTEPSLPDRPSAPNKKLILLGSILGSFFVTLAIVLLWRLDRRQKMLTISLNALPKTDEAVNALTTGDNNANALTKIDKK